MSFQPAAPQSVRRPIDETFEAFGFVREYAPELFVLAVIVSALIVAGYGLHWFAARGHLTDLRELVQRLMDRERKP